MLYFEDFTVGDLHDLGRVTVDEAAIVAFATAWDPQPMHMDAVAARAGSFGTLIASGWHAAALATRLLSEWQARADVVGLEQREIEALRWLRPIRPGDVLTGRLEVLSAAAGICRCRVELIDQEGHVATSLEGPFAITRREPAT